MTCSDVTEEEGAEYTLRIVQGSYFERTLYIKNPDGTAKDLTGWLLAYPTGAGLSVAQIRRKKGDASALAFITLAFKDADPELGAIVFTLTDTQTAAISAGEHSSAVASQGVWEFKPFNSDGRPRRLLYGNVIIERSASRPA